MGHPRRISGQHLDSAGQERFMNHQTVIRPVDGQPWHREKVADRSPSAVPHWLQCLVPHHSPLFSWTGLLRYMNCPRRTLDPDDHGTAPDRPGPRTAFGANLASLTEKQPRRSPFIRISSGFSREGVQTLGKGLRKPAHLVARFLLWRLLSAGFLIRGSYRRVRAVLIRCAHPLLNSLSSLGY